MVQRVRRTPGRGHALLPGFSLAFPQIHQGLGQANDACVGVGFTLGYTIKSTLLQSVGV